MLTLLNQGLRGQASLQRAFWLLFLPMTTAQPILGTILFSAGLLGSAAPRITSIFGLIGFSVQILGVVVLWACSRNTESKILSIAARTLVVILIAAPLLIVIGAIAFLLYAAAHDS